VQRKQLISKKLSPLLITAIVISSLSLIFAQDQDLASNTDKEQVLNAVAKDWMQVGQTQYNKGFYVDAESSLMNAIEYQDFLADADIEKIDELLENIQVNFKEKYRVLEYVKKANELISQGKLKEARSYLDAVKDSQYLEQSEKEQIQLSLTRIGEQLASVQEESVLASIRLANELIIRGELVQARAQLNAVKDDPLLSPEDREKIIGTLARIDMQLLKDSKNRILTHIQGADELIQQGEYQKAKAYLETIRDTEKLDPEHHELIAERLEFIRSQLGQQEDLVDELYGRSIELYRAGRVEEARAGFDEIDRILISRQQASQPQPQELIPQEMAETSIEDAIIDPQIDRKAAGSAEIQEISEIRESKEDDQVEIVDQKISILRSYVKATVKNAFIKTQDYINQGEFDRAKKTLISAQQVLLENRSHIGEEFFQKFDDQLKNMMGSVSQLELEAAG